MSTMGLDLDNLAARMAAAGFREYLDFFITNRADGTLTSSELVCLWFHDDVYDIFYRDAGQSLDILTTHDPAEAERVFVHETRVLVEDRYRRRFPEVENA